METFGNISHQVLSRYSLFPLIKFSQRLVGFLSPFFFFYKKLLLYLLILSIGLVTSYGDETMVVVVWFNVVVLVGLIGWLVCSSFPSTQSHWPFGSLHPWQPMLPDFLNVSLQKDFVHWRIIYSCRVFHKKHLSRMF